MASSGDKNTLLDPTSPGGDGPPTANTALRTQALHCTRNAITTVKIAVLLPAIYVLVSTRKIRDKWSQLTDKEQDRFCHLCGHISSNKRTKKQHAQESHVGRRCHFPVPGNHNMICGKVFESEADVVLHLDDHMLPAEKEKNGNFRCGWCRDEDCKNRRDQAGFKMQESMLRHARKHQSGKARQAGDIVDRPFPADG